MGATWEFTPIDYEKTQVATENLNWIPVLSLWTFTIWKPMYSQPQGHYVVIYLSLYVPKMHQVGVSGLPKYNGYLLRGDLSNSYNLLYDGMIARGFSLC